mmetsp:Transcript_99542/g.172799  ORF Transcript_99542/g.172799 Transcript_99542/m.172799 type:complete len:201 (-) Transcript_99542:96-698(-)
MASSFLGAFECCMSRTKKDELADAGVGDAESLLPHTPDGDDDDSFLLNTEMKTEAEEMEKGKEAEPSQELSACNEENPELETDNVEEGTEAQPSQEISTCNEEKPELETDKVEEEEEKEEKQIEIEKTMTEEASPTDKEPQTPSKSASTTPRRFTAFARCAPTFCSPSSKTSTSPKVAPLPNLKGKPDKVSVDDEALIGA